MKHPVRRFLDPAVALKELERFVRDGTHLQVGKPFKRFGGLRSREILANWLLCAVMSEEGPGGPYFFTTDPLGGDGIVCDESTEVTWPTEHVMVPEVRGTDGLALEERILEQVRNKVAKGGKSYADGKTLIVFLNASGAPWHPNKVARGLPEPIYFDAVWVMGLHSVEDGEYVYGVSNLHRNAVNSPVWRVRIGRTFESWVIERIQ